MFDSTLCDRPFPEKPFFLDWFKLNWVNKPLLLVLLALAFLGLYLLMQHKPWRKWLSKPKTILLLFGFTATLPIMLFVAAQALVVFLPKDSGTAADAIVILGRGPLFDKQRINLATELWQAKRAPMIFMSGRGDAYRTIEELETKGIPKQALDGENCSVSTQENAIFTAAVLQPRGIRKILLITDKPHMLRSLLVFRANGFTVIPRPSSISSYFFGERAKFFLTVREYAGLVNYAFRGLYLPQRSLELNNSDIVNLIQKAKQYGQQQGQ